MWEKGVGTAGDSCLLEKQTETFGMTCSKIAPATFIAERTFRLGGLKTSLLKLLDLWREAPAGIQPLDTCSFNVCGEHVGFFDVGPHATTCDAQGDPQFLAGSLSVLRNSRTGRHIDAFNAGPSLICVLGTFTSGGQTGVELGDPHYEFAYHLAGGKQPVSLCTYAAAHRSVQPTWRQDASNQLLDVKGKITLMNSRSTHWTTQWPPPGLVYGNFLSLLVCVGAVRD
jgi:hypothetical protein